MPRNRIDANVRCPSCNGQLFPRVLVCDSCGLKVEGDFVLNEFGALTPDELHFLRVFIHCEGRIRDMEAALGVSYPTVKGHLASIKEKLNLTRLGPKPAAPADVRASEPGASAGPAEGLSPDEVLDALEQGRIAYKDAVRLLRANPPSKSPPDPPRAEGSARPEGRTSGRKKEGKADEQQPSG